MANLTKQIGSISTIQPRIATGLQQDSETKVYIYNGEFGIAGTMDKDEAADYDQYGLLAGYYTVTHSSCMAGSWDEIINDWTSIIIKDMVAKKTAKEINKYTTMANI